MNEFLRIENLSKTFMLKAGSLWGKRKPLHAVRQISFDLNRGEIFGIVGESGCGKSTLARLLLNLVPASSGSILFEGTELTKVSAKAMRSLRCQMQMIFQDPYASLNPRMTIYEILKEPLDFHRIGTSGERRSAVFLSMERVGLRPELAMRYPHEFSGGQRQRIGIARALSLKPKLIIADEPVSALDVSVQAQY